MNCAICNKPDAADSLGDHQIGCGGNGDRIHCRDALRDVLFSAAEAKEGDSGTYCRLSSHPANIFLPNWCGGRPAAVDVTVISPLHHLPLAGAASVRGHALQVAEDRKRAAHHANCGAAGIVFLPIAVEVLGQVVGVRKLFFTFQKSVDSWGSGWGFLQTRLQNISFKD